MAEIVNLNRARKDRAKGEAKANTAANRVAHGLTRTQRQAVKTERERAERLIDGHRRDD